MTHDALPGGEAWFAEQLLHTEAPAALYWLAPHMTAVVFFTPPEHAYPAGHCTATDEFVVHAYPAGPARSLYHQLSVTTAKSE